jgi:Protein kinase domain
MAQHGAEGSNDVVLTPFSDQDIHDISESLLRAGQESWSKILCIYAVLKFIKQSNWISTFVREGITDLGFPFAERTLPSQFSNPATRRDFLSAQRQVLSKALLLEKGNRHHHFPDEAAVPLASLAELGKGNFGRVDRVRCDGSSREYARKRMLRGPNSRQDKKVLIDFENELRNLKKVMHHHVVELVGSYTDPRWVGILMLPVANYDLQRYLEGPYEATLV